MEKKEDASFSNDGMCAGTSVGSQPQKPQKSPKSFKHIPFCRAFYADHFSKKTFLISSTNDGAWIKKY
jgi:hypothetical protein